MAKYAGASTIEEASTNRRAVCASSTNLYTIEIARGEHSPHAGGTASATTLWVYLLRVSGLKLDEFLEPWLRFRDDRRTQRLLRNTSARAAASVAALASESLTREAHFPPMRVPARLSARVTAIGNTTRSQQLPLAE